MSAVYKSHMCICVIYVCGLYIWVIYKCRFCLERVWWGNPGFFGMLCNPYGYNVGLRWASCRLALLFWYGNKPQEAAEPTQTDIFSLNLCCTQKYIYQNCKQLAYNYTITILLGLFGVICRFVRLLKTSFRLIWASLRLPAFVPVPLLSARNS